MDSTDNETGYTRRGILRAGAGTAVGLAGVSGSVGAQSNPYGGHLSDADWDGSTVDARGAEEVIVEVGTGTQGVQFSPPAILIEPGQTVTWQWTGQGGGHNVAPQGETDFEDFGSTEIVSEPGHTVESTFEEEGLGLYVCQPHVTLGMAGVVAVGEDNAETDLVPYGDGGGGGGLAVSTIMGGTAVFGTISVVGVAAYRELVGEGTDEY